MGTKIKYMNKEDIKYYLADKIQIIHYALMKKEYVSHLQQKNFIKDLRTDLYKNDSDKRGYCKISFIANYNLIKIIRNYCNIELGLRTKGSIWSYDSNFIPVSIRRSLDKLNISYHELRKKGIELLFEEMRQNEELILRRIYGKNKKDKTYTFRFNKSISQIEICIDIESPLPIQLSEDLNIRSSFKRNIKTIAEISLDNYGNKNKERFDLIKNCYPEANKGREFLKGECWDGTHIKLYTKELTHLTALNRLERTYPDKKKIRKAVGKNSFQNQEDFWNILHELALKTHDTFLPILNLPIEFDEKIMNSLILAQCKVGFGKYYEYAFKDLTSGNCAITTGKEGKSIHPVEVRAREIAREGGFLKKVEGRRGCYVIDKHKIKKSGTNNQHPLI